MTRVLSLPTDHTDVAAAVASITERITDSFIRVPSAEAVGAGEWVRFRWLLADGLAFFEGVGRCETARALEGGYELVLGALSFDAKNEAMFERILLSAEGGPSTGRHTPVRARKVDEIGPRYASVPPKPAKPPPAKLDQVVKSALKPKPPAPPPSSGAIPAELRERARQLARRLNLVAPSLARGRWTEERVIESALRMGIESLEGLVKRGEG